MRISDWSSDVCASDLVYEAIDWQVIVLLAAMMPVGEALETTGAAKVLAEWLTAVAGMLPVWGIMGLLLVLTMLLSDIMNNAATAVVMAPIGIALASAIGVSSEEHTSELQSLMRISYAVFCLKKKIITDQY